MKTFSEHLHDVVSETRPISEDRPESMDMCEEAAKRYAREAIAEHLEREITDDEINMAAMIDSTGRSINQPGEIWKRAISWYKSRLNEKT